MSERNRLVLVGLDGATFDVLDPLMRDGVMPFLARTSSTGARGVLLSTVHPLTPIAWTSLMTGRHPGHHGVFDFVRVEDHGGRPGYTLGTSADVRVETLWSMASRHGLRVTTLNFPCMFPPPELNGFVVPGFVPWAYLPRAVHPRDLYPRLKALPEFNARELALDWTIERKALQGLPAEEFEPWIEFHIAREAQWFAIVQLLMREEPCDLTAILFDGVDKLQHLCYHLIHPELAATHRSPWERRVRARCLDYFRQLDGFLAGIAAMAGADAHLVFASDHGFQAAGQRIFYANVWLQEHGYLEWAAGTSLDTEGRLTPEDHSGPEGLFDWSATHAVALTASSNAIFIRRAQTPDGPGVREEDYDAFRSRLARGLLEFVDPATGQRVVERVLTREQAFPGTEVKRAPDLTLVLRDRSFLSVLRADSPLRTRTAPYGTHHPHGIFMAGGPGIRRGAELPPLGIVDVTPTVLQALGLPLPPDLDGTPALGIFEPSFLASHPVRTEGPGHGARMPLGRGEGGIGPEGEQEIFERLRALGYLE